MKSSPCDSIFHWLTNLNPNGECFVYDFLLMWVFLMLMESALLMVIEVLKNDFLCPTFGLIFIGSNMVFTGFFRKVAASPPWISWMCYVVPFRVSDLYTCCFLNILLTTILMIQYTNV